MTEISSLWTKSTDAHDKTYDRRSLTYANSFDNSLKSIFIRGVEWCTGKLSCVRRVRRFEKRGVSVGQTFWHDIVDVMGIEVQTPQSEIEKIPSSGPVVLVANHPHGLVDGILLADLIGRRRRDYRILTRALLTGIDETASSHMISVPFPDEPDAQQKMLDMRSQAMAHLEQSGLIALFPSGGVAHSDTAFGPVIEREWNVFTAKMIRKSGATIVPLYFPGVNSRAYQIANRISPVLRQSLLLHEVARAFDKPQRPVIGDPIAFADIEGDLQKPRDFMEWLRTRTLALKQEM